METIKRIYWPAVNLIGPGAVKEVGAEITKLGLKRILIVTDKVLRSVGVVKKVTDVLNAAGIHYVIYDEVKPNPTTKNVADGLDLFYGLCCDGLMSIGGGSPQDAAKAIGILQTNGGNIQQYEGIGKSKRKSIPIVAINTTAGAASEVTINYVITDELRKIKMMMVDPNCLATVTVNDPELMINKPADLTAATGFDVLTHAVEAYVAKDAFRFSNVLALEAIKLVGESLIAAVKNGTDMTARTKMAWASFAAGLSFSNCGSGIAHSMADQLSAEYDLPHGVANAILLPYVVEFNSLVCPEKFRDIAVALGKKIDGLTVEQAANEAVKALRELAAELQIPQLKETAFNPDDIEKLSIQAMADVCTAGNPREVKLGDIKSLYLKAYMETPKAEKQGKRKALELA
jgi:alcohol dehydrogenase